MPLDPLLRSRASYAFSDLWLHVNEAPFIVVGLSTSRLVMLVVQLRESLRITLPTFGFRVNSVHSCDSFALGSGFSASHINLY